MKRFRTWLAMACALALGLVLVACGGSGTDGGAAQDVDYTANFAGVWEIETYVFGDEETDVAARVAQGFSVFLVLNEDGTGEWNDSGLETYGLTWEATSATEATGTWDDPNDPNAPVITLEGDILRVVDGEAESTFHKSTQAAFDAMLAADDTETVDDTEPSVVPDGWTGELTETYTNETYGYSIKLPEGMVEEELDGPDFVAHGLENPYLEVHTYVETPDEEATIADFAASLEEWYDASIISQDETEVVALMVDADTGDEDLLRTILHDGTFYTAEAYFEPANDEVVGPVAQAILDSLTV